MGFCGEGVRVFPMLGCRLKRRNLIRLTSWKWEVGKMIRRLSLPGMLLLVCCSAVGAQKNPFLGKWDITATTAKESYPYWLEVKEENGRLVGYFLNRTGGVRKLAEIAVEGQELVFSTGASRPNAPKPVHRAHIDKSKLIGELTAGTEKIPWVGVRPPKWGNYNANAAHRFGKTISLFNGKDLSGWRFQFSDKPSGWSVVDGMLTNHENVNNIISQQKFKDFKLVVEYKVENKSNSGLYLRGRYELQVLDDAGTEPNVSSHMAIYSRVPPAINASKPAGEWQTAEVTLVGNRVTVVLNGQKVHDNVVIDGITGGALDSDEGAPGPIMIQGDHSRIWVRKVVVTPIL